MVRQARCAVFFCHISMASVWVTPQQHLEPVAGAALEWHMAGARGRQAQPARAAAPRADELYVQVRAWACALQGRQRCCRLVGWNSA